MSIGPFGGIQGSAAGAPLSQSRGGETERNSQQSTAAERKAEAADKSEKAAGIGQTEEDQETSDRDADGRRMYEDTLEIEDENNGEVEPESEPDDDAPPKSKDPTGEAGNTLDLIG